MYTRQELRNFRTAVEVFDDIGQPYAFPGVIRAPFPNNRGDLPIVFQDYPYTMDIMYLTSVAEERHGKS